MKMINDADINGNNYIGKDLLGYPYNRKYPPDIKKYGSHYSGYRTFQEECFFYDFAVQHYFVCFKYKGQNYYIVSWEDCCARTDETWNDVFERWKAEIGNE